MWQRDDSISLQHMRNYIEEAISMVHGRKRSDLDTDRMLELALIRLVEIAGEAANRVTDEGQKKYAFLPWKQLRGMRNRLIHGYDDVDLDVLWNTIQIDFPALLNMLHKIV